MTSKRGGPLALHVMQTCTVTVADPDTAALAEEIRNDEFLADVSDACMTALAVFEHRRRYALQRVFAVYSCALSQIHGDSWLSVDAGLDPTRFSVIFPDKKGKDVGTFEHRVHNFREALRDDWFRTWGYNLRSRTDVIEKPGAERYFYEMLFDRLVTISDFSEVTVTWSELLEKGKAAEALLHREAYLYGLNSGMPSGLSCSEASGWSRTDRICALAPLSVRKLWEFRGHSLRETVMRFTERGIRPILRDVPTWAVVESLESPLESFRDLLGRVLERDWHADTPEVQALLEKSRSAVFAGVDGKIARWCSPTVFARTEPGYADVPKPSVLALFKNEELGADSLYW